MNKSNSIHRSRVLTGLFLLIAFTLLFSRGTTDVDYYAAWGREASVGNLFRLYHGGPAGDFLYRLTDSVTGTIPYPPVFVYLVGTIALVLKSVFGTDDLIFRISANLLGLCGSLFALTRIRQLSTKAENNLSLLLIGCCMVYISPILGYQDGVILSLLLVALKFEKSENFILSGLFLAAAVLTKQLVLIVLPGIVLYQIFNKREKVFIPVLKLWTSFVLSAFLFLSPFLLTDHGLRIFHSLVESSNHAALSANGANLGWFITWVSRIRSNGLFEGAKLGGSGNFTWELAVRNYTVSVRLVLLLIMLSIMGLIALIAMRCRYRNKPFDIYVAGSAVYLSYCCFGTGVHENHVYLGLGLVTCAELVRSNKITKLTLLGWFMLCGHLFSTYGFGRSVAFRVVPDILIQVFIFLALLTYLSLLIRSILWLSFPPPGTGSTKIEKAPESKCTV
jgi:hypothetical protein